MTGIRSYNMLRQQKTGTSLVAAILFAIIAAGCGSNAEISVPDGDSADMEPETGDIETPQCTKDIFPDLGEDCEAYEGCYGTWECNDDNSGVVCQPSSDCIPPACSKDNFPNLGDPCEASYNCYGTWECNDDNTDVYCRPGSDCAPDECSEVFFPNLGNPCEAYYNCYGTWQCNDDNTDVECIPLPDCPPPVDGDIDGNEDEIGACNNDAFPELGESCEAYYGCYGTWVCTEDNSAVYCKPGDDCNPPADGDDDAVSEEETEAVDSDIIETDGDEDTPSEEDLETVETEDAPAEEDVADPEPEPEPEIEADPEFDPEPDPETEIIDTVDEDDTVTYEPPYTGLENVYDADLKYALYNIVKNHTSLGYSNAKEVMFGDIDNINGRVQCVYTGTWVTTTGIPNNNTMNTEHTWAQSWGADNEPARSDIHHLFPTLSPVNSRRSNYPFGWVVNVSWQQGGSKLGTDAWGDTVFEVRPENRGDTARAILYFAVRYAYTVDAHMEAAMKEWNSLDPPDDIERTRNDNIERYQHNRNPFVDHPEFVEHISDF